MSYWKHRTLYGDSGRVVSTDSEVPAPEVAFPGAISENPDASPSGPIGGESPVSPVRKSGLEDEIGSPWPWPLTRPGYLQVAVTTEPRAPSHPGIQISSLHPEYSSHGAFGLGRVVGPDPCLSLKWTQCPRGRGIPYSSPWTGGPVGVEGLLVGPPSPC